MQESIQQALTLSATPDSVKLNLLFSDKVVSHDERLSKTEAINPPTLRIDPQSQGPFLVVAVDLDAPYPSAPFLSPIVHWIQPGLNAASTGTLSYQVPCIIDWLAPTPPPLSGPHRYLIILYQQPADFDAAEWDVKYKKPVGVGPRIRWSLDDYVKQADLKSMVAANYFCA